MIIETHGLTKKFGTKIANNAIDIAVEEGQVYGFLGRNGAGKSTFIKMLMGLVFPTSGEGTVLGKPLGHVEARKKIGYLPELFRYQDWMTGLDLLKFHAQLIGLKQPVERISEVLKTVGLEGQEKYKVGGYSKGMQQRIGLACALLPNPQLLFLDEPTSALDPIGRKDVRDMIVSLKKQGMTVFLNSHLLNEVESVCDHLTIIHKGQVAKSTSMAELLSKKMTVSIQLDEISSEVFNALKKKCPSLEKQADGRLTVALENLEEIPPLASELVSSGLKLYALEPQQQTLESAFLSIVGEEEHPS